MRLYGQWMDIATGNVGSTVYLLQAKRSWRGKLKFRVESITSFTRAPSLEDLQKVHYKDAPASYAEYLLRPLKEEASDEA